MKRYLLLTFSIFILIFSPCYLPAQSAEKYLSLADSFFTAGYQDSVLAYSLKAEPLIKKDSGELSHAYARFTDQYLGLTYEALGNYADAKKCYEKSLRIYRAINWMGLTDNDYGEAVINTANLYNILGAYSEAVQLFITGRNIFKNVPFEQSQAYAIATNGLATAYNFMGESTKAGFIYTELLAMMKSLLGGDENEPCATVYNNLSTVYQKLGQYDKAVVSSKKAVGFFKNSGPQFQKKYAGCLILLGTIYIQMGKADSASAYYKEALEKAVNTKDDYYIAAISGLLGKIEDTKGNFSTAENLYFKALEASCRLDSLPTNSYYIVSCNLAFLYSKTGRYKKADSLFNLLLYQAREVRSTEYKLNDLIHYGYCINSFAQRKLQVAADSLEAMNRRLFGFIEKNFKGMNEQEKLDFISSLYKNFNLQYTFLASSKILPASFISAAYHNELLLKGLVRFSQGNLIKKMNETGNEKLKDIYDKWRLNRQVLYKQYAQGENKERINTDSVEKETEAFEKEMSLSFTDADNPLTQSILNTEKVAGNLKANQAAIEFVRFNFIKNSLQTDSVLYGAFIVLPADTLPHFVVLCNESDLLNLMQNKNGKLLTSNEMVNTLYPQNIAKKALITKINIKLYQLIWQPMLPYLNNCSSIYYSPAGLLNNISLNAVSNGSKGLLTDSYNLYQLFSTGSLASKKEAGNSLPDSISLWANMDYDIADTIVYISKAGKAISPIPGILPDTPAKGQSNGKWNYLGTAEADSLKSIFKKTNKEVKIFEATSATEDNFKQYVNAFHGVVHLSTHGFYAPEKNKTEAFFTINNFTSNTNPLFRCGLIFSGANYVWQGNEPLDGKDDGVLTAYEISQMDLSNVKLITLSACETGLGEIKGYEGVFGLQRAFKMAGVQTMMVSLWQVPTVQTTELMEGFYAKWLSGINMHDALLQTQKEMYQKYPPYYWAGFVLIE